MRIVESRELRVERITLMIFKALALFALTLNSQLSTLNWLYADSNPANDAAAITISITPNIDRGIMIDTGNVNLDLGNLDMNASSQTVMPATVTILGNITNSELDLSAGITGGWVFDPNQTFASTGTNQLNMWASFTTISSAAAPSQGDEYFRVGTSSGAKFTSNTENFGPQPVGVNNGSGVGFFEPNDPASDMDGLNPGDRRHLWIYLHTPPTTSVTTQQKININLSVRPGP